MQQDEGDGSCDSYVLGRVCDGDAEDHEAYGTSYENSKLMDYKAGHDAGYAAVSSHCRTEYENEGCTF